MYTRMFIEWLYYCPFAVGAVIVDVVVVVALVVIVVTVDVAFSIVAFSTIPSISSGG